MLAQVGQFYSDEVDQYYSGANRLQLIEGKPLEFLTPQLFMPREVPVLRALEVAIEGDEVPHDQLSHYVFSSMTPVV